MEVIDWGGGLTKHEIEAIEKMKLAFSDSRKIETIAGKAGKKMQSIFPWKGYSGFRFADVQGRKEGEFDLVIVTHCIVLIIELKHWNNGKITSIKDRWYLDDKEMGRSPVSVTRNKQYLLGKKLDKFKHQFTNKGSHNKGQRPCVHFLIVMTGNANFDSLPDCEKNHVLSLTDFLELKNEKKFNAYFRPHPDSKTLNQDFHVFDKKIFNLDTVKPKSINGGGYYADDLPIFKHPKKIYCEYEAYSENKKQKDKALLRRWDFTQIHSPEAQTPDGRYRLVSREYDVLNYIKLKNKELYHNCLNYKSMPQKSEISAEHIDIFELFPQQKRFNQFVGGYHIQNMNNEQILDLIQILLNKFAQLHDIGIAHRDLNENSIWLSNDDSITLSSFAVAYVPSEQTVGDIREILSITGDLLAQSIFSCPSNITPYQYDVRSLAVLVWHIFKKERVSSESMKSMKNDLEGNKEWYADLLRSALSEITFKNAREFLVAFNQAKPVSILNFSFDFSQLELYTHNINHSLAYHVDNFITETNEKEIYCSNNYLVKVWLNSDPRENEQKARIVLEWLENIAKLAKFTPDYLPKIRQFGIAKKTGALFCVSDYIENSFLWSKINDLQNLTDTDKINLIYKLLHNIEHLHSLGFTHGDLKPENVLVNINNDNISLYLLDILDFSPDGKRQFNTEYSPIFDNATEKQRDNFAVMKMSCELLGLAWNAPSDYLSEISEVVQLEYNDTKSGFISLARFRDVLNPKPRPPMIEIFISGLEAFNPLKIYSENDKLFVQFEKSKQNDVLVHFIGLGGILKVFYSVRDKKFVYALSPTAREYITKNDRDKSILSLSIGLSIIPDLHSNLDSLNNIVKEHELFNQSMSRFISEHNLDKSESQSDETEIEANFEHGSSSNKNNITDQRPSIQRLWHAILETETEALPSITASECLQKTEYGDSYIPYDGEINPIDQFKRDEIVEAIGRNEKNDKIYKYGTVNITKSILNELHLNPKKITGEAQMIKADSVVYLQSKQNKVSYQRRKRALQRILDEESVIKKLSNYFDENCKLPAIKYDIQVSDEDFKRYDQPDKNISLNEAQRQAFQSLIANGPLSLLQGPPGTGKTEFIAAFVHYLFETQNIKNMLLVSQSHEAVNTAAERIRRHCLRLGTDLQIVRFSNREIADSEELEDVFSPNLVGQKYQQLNVNKIENISQLGRAIGLPESYLKERSELEFDIGVQIRRYLKLKNSTNSHESITDDEKKLYKPLELNIRERAKQLGLNDVSSMEIEQILPTLVNQIDILHKIQPNESYQAEKIINLTRDMLEALSNERTNYDEFLARSRQLVVGTCVGIGQKHIGIADNTYDWVIVDEAARSISSELAIAMQSGTRILLVGDHKQLPPLYSEEHKNALARCLAISKRGEELDQILGSDFERVFQSNYGKQTCAILKTQYRMAPAIGNLVSACFYEGRLENGKQDKDIPLIYHTLPKNFQASVAWLDTSKLSNSYHEQAKNGSLTNRAEADVIIALLQDLSKDSTFIDSEIVQKCLQTNTQVIGVICMYGEQKKFIRKKFSEKTWSDSFRRLVKIDSVDSYQGKENRIIILSLTRHDKKHSTGFLYLPNRINVALSRSMDKLIIVGAKVVWEDSKNQKTPLGKVLRFIQLNLDQKNYVLIDLSSGVVRK